MSATFADLISLSTTSSSHSTISFAATVDPTFTIGPKVHGGSLQAITAAAAREGFRELLRAQGHDVDDSLVPVAIASDYLAAPDPAAIDVAVTLRKRGRTVCVLVVEIAQGGRTMVSSSVTMARQDSGTPVHSAPHVLADVPLEPVTGGIDIHTSSLGEVMHLGPALDLVLDPSSFAPARGETGDPVVIGWTRPTGGVDADADFAVLVCDVSPPVVMNLGMFGWAPTVQLTTYVRRTPAAGWLRFAATSVEVGPGMFEEDHLVVDSTGAVVAQSRQLALIPARG